jgi:ribonuclease BN (tRNA processing enzyme)
VIITFLGVGEAFGQFANTSILVDGKILLECGPHTLLQLRKQQQDLKEIELVFLSHFHGDHTLGLPALKSMEDLSFELDTFEVPDLKEETTHKDYKLEFAQTTHSIECCSVAISKNGKKMTYTSDGAPTEDTVSIARDSDLLIAEAYSKGFSGHSSAVKAAELAFRSHSKSLALVHISRNKNGEEELFVCILHFPIFR